MWNCELQNTATMPPSASEQVVPRLTAIIRGALPHLSESDLIDLLDFMEVQFSGSCFNPDNTARSDEVVSFLHDRPFAISSSGVDALACLASHTLRESERVALNFGATGRATSAEHQLWLLATSALNTAAVIRASKNGVATEAFDWIEQRADVRSKYLQRHFAAAAMRDWEVRRDKLGPDLTSPTRSERN